MYPGEKVSLDYIDIDIIPIVTLFIFLPITSITTKSNTKIMRIKKAISSKDNVLSNSPH